MILKQNKLQIQFIPFTCYTNLSSFTYIWDNTVRKNAFNAIYMYK